MACSLALRLSPYKKNLSKCRRHASDILAWHWDLLLNKSEKELEMEWFSHSVILCSMMTFFATHGTSLTFWEVLWWINSPVKSIVQFRFHGHDLSRKEADFMEEVVSEVFGWQDLRQGIPMEALVSTVAVEREGRRLTPTLLSYFSALRIPFGSRGKDELHASFPVFLKLSF